VRLDAPSQTSIDRTTGELDEKTANNISNEPDSPVDPVAAKPTNAPATQRTLKPKTAARAPRLNTKKARAEAELLRRQEYAQKLFDDLNKSVFKEGLPASTKLVWNKRLLTTAGKAKYHRYDINIDKLSTCSLPYPAPEKVLQPLRLSLQRKS
jgi:hypothetical protein